MARPAPPLQALWAFHLVAETGSVTGAAAALGVTQPAVSRRLRELEATLGCALVRRGANALSLTAAGARLAAELHPGFARIEAALRGVPAEAQPLRIRAYTTWALRWLIPRLPRFRQLHPGIEVEVTTSTATVVDLAREGVDAAIRTAPLDAPPTPTARRLQPVRIAPFAAPSAGADAPRLGSKVRPGDWARWQRQAGLPPASPPLLFESTTLAIQAAIEGLGRVICPPDFVQAELRAGRLVALAEAPVLAGDGYWLVLPTGRLDAPLQTFADWLVAEAG